MIHSMYNMFMIQNRENIDFLKTAHVDTLLGKLKSGNEA